MRFAMVLLLLALAACARLPAEDAAGTPAEAASRSGFAQLRLTGLPIGSAVAIAPDRLLTNAHVIPPGTEAVAFRRGDDAASGTALVLARSTAMDLAILAVPPVFRPIPMAPAPPAEGTPIWAAGAPAAGPAIAAGHVLRPAVTLAGHGPGFTAQLGALMGYSGGPALDAQGRLLGLVTALPRPGAAPVLAALTGLDLDGIARGAAGREVFLLGIAPALAEARRLAP